MISKGLKYHKILKFETSEIITLIVQIFCNSKPVELICMYLYISSFIALLFSV